MATPGDDVAAAGRGHLRASHADRDQVVGTLKVAFVQGRLTKDEFDLRVGQAFAARTYADLAALTADIPAGLADTQPPRPVARAQGWPPLNNSAKTAMGVIVAAIMVTAVLWVTAWFAGNGAALGAAIVATGTDFMIIFVAGAKMLDGRRQRPRGSLPSAPSAGGRVSRRPGPPGQLPRSGQLPSADHHQPHTAETARIRLPHGPRYAAQGC